MNKTTCAIMLFTMFAAGMNTSTFLTSVMRRDPQSWIPAVLIVSTLACTAYNWKVMWP